MVKIKAIVSKSGTDYVISVYRNSEYLETRTYPYIPRRIAQDFAISRLRFFGATHISGKAIWEGTDRFSVSGIVR